MENGEMQAQLSSSSSSCDTSLSLCKLLNASVEVTDFMRIMRTDSSLSPKKIAEYLHEMPKFNPKMVRIALKLYTPGVVLSKGLGKLQVGHILGEPDAKSQSVLLEYANLFQFKSVSFDIALRVYLGRFELPREAQKIDRILQAFAKAFYTSNPDSDECPSEDAVYTLAFSVLLLSTDAHNPRLALKFKMTRADFIRNYHRLGREGSSARAEVPDQYLGKCYDLFVADAIKRFERKPVEMLRDEVELEFPGTALGLDIETSFDGRTAIVKKYTNDCRGFSSIQRKQLSASLTASSLYTPTGSFLKTGSSIFSTIFASADPKLECSVEGYVIVAVGNDSTRHIGYALTLYLLKTAPRPVLIRFCEPSVYCASLV